MGVLIELCVAGLECQQMLIGRADRELKYSIVGPSNPLIVLASILIFYGFTVLDVRKDLTKLSSLTFEIYLIHAGVWHFISNVIKLAGGKDIFTKMDGVIWIPMFVVVVFVISYELSKIYIWLWGKLDKKKRITNKLLRIVHL